MGRFAGFVAVLTLALGVAIAPGVPALAQEAGDEGPAEVRAAEQASEQARTVRVKILGMSCPFCAYGVQQKLKKLDEVKELEIDLGSGVATLTMEGSADLPNERLEETVVDAGFEVAAIVRSFDSEHEDLNPDEMPGT